MTKICCVCNKKLGLFSTYFGLADGYLCTDCAEKLTLYNLGSLKDIEDFLHVRSTEPIINLAKDFESNQETLWDIKKSILKDDPIQISNYLFDTKAGIIFIDHTLDEHAKIYSFKDFKSIRQHVTKEKVGKKHIVRNMVIGNLVAGNVGKYYAATHSPNKIIYTNLGAIVTFKNGFQYEFKIPTTNALIDSRLGIEEKKQYDDMLSILKSNKIKFRETKRRTHTKNIDPAKEIKELNDLKNQGIITEEEFEAKKRQLLDL